MKKVEKDFENPPAILLSQGRMEKLKTALANQNALHLSSTDYGPKAVKDKLEAIYHFKCAYCESTVKQVASLQVEHYRPKNAVTDGAGHTGYYWLALEWSNLVLGCPACNGQGAKGNKFPVLGNRAPAHDPFSTGNFSRSGMYAHRSPLLDEQPLLLHPEIDDPKPHFRFTGFGILEGLSDRGVSTVEVCDLNRDPLYKERQKIINEFLLQCDIFFEGKKMFGIPDDMMDFFLKKELLVLKSKMDMPIEPYTSFVEYLLENPETCILPRIIGDDNQADFRRAFEQFRLTELT